MTTFQPVYRKKINMFFTHVFSLYIFLNQKEGKAAKRRQVPELECSAFL